MSAVHDTMIIFRRQLRLGLRNPAWIIIGLLQPVLYLVLFGPLLKPLSKQLGTSNAYAVFVPGLLIQLGLFGALFTGFELVAEWRAGVIEAQRVTPASRTALLLGRVLRDVLELFVQGIVLIALAYAFGLRASFGGMLFGLALMLLLGTSCAALSDMIGLLTKSEEVLAPTLNSIALPVMLLSGILLPISLGPKWLQHLSDIVPTSHIVTAIRAAFVGHFGMTVVWGSLWAIALCAVCLYFGTRAFWRENA
jgi:ABC-2 type transport system permease protein